MTAKFTLTGTLSALVGSFADRSVYAQASTQVSNPTEDIVYALSSRTRSTGGSFSLSLPADDALNLPHDAGGPQFYFTVTIGAKTWTVPAQATNSTHDLTEFTSAVPVSPSTTDATIIDNIVAGRIAAPGSATAGALAPLLGAAAGAIKATSYTLNDAGLSSALTTGATLGLPVLIPAGTTITLTGTVTLPTKTHLILDGTISHTATSGAALSATGTEGATAALTANATRGSRTVVATGHGLVAGDWFRVGSNALFDSHSTSSTIGEIVRVASVSGATITTWAPLADSYATADTAGLSKVTLLDPIVVEGSGRIVGNKSTAAGQYGISIIKGLAPRIRGIRFEDIDQRHIFLRDCLNFSVRECSFDWAIHTSQAYAVSVSDASQDGFIEGCSMRYVRHAFTTNNTGAASLPGGRGIPRRIRFAHNTVEWSSTATGGSMTGGDAIDTHTAAEDIWIEYNTVRGSAGQGINFECASGRVIGNKVTSTTSHGISVHNESDRQGRVEVDGNLVDTPAVDMDGIRVILGTRGTVATYDHVLIGRKNRVYGVTGTGLPVNAVGEDDAYLTRTIASDAVTVLPSTRVLRVSSEAAASTDNLTNISGGRLGQVLTVFSGSNAQDITIVANTGNIRTTTSANYAMDAARDSITLRCDGTNWIELSRADFAAA